VLLPGIPPLPADTQFRHIKMPAPAGTTVPAGGQDVYAPLFPVAPTPSTPPDPVNTANYYYVYDTGTFAPTAASPTPVSAWPASLALGIRGIKITLRVWDFRTEQTRQITIIQDL